MIHGNKKLETHPELIYTLTSLTTTLLLMKRGGDMKYFADSVSCCFFVLPCHLQATTYTSMSDKALLNQSPIVIAGNVIGIAQDATPQISQTLYTVLVTELLKGVINANEIIIAVPGGMTQNGM